MSNKIREKFGPAERRGSDLADNDARSMIGQCCALFDARSGRVRQTKRGDHGIPGAGHIENFARECRQVVGIHGVEKGHSIFTPRDQCIVTAKFFQQLVPCLLQRCFVGNGRPGEQFRFTLIRSDYRYRPVIVGMLDLAAKQLEEAAREILAMDPTKKEVMYNLGIVYEMMADPEKSLACMKQIYETDYGYKDVARRVESSYRI